MSTTIKPVLSKKSPYYISKHRYYELKHFCLQYPEWRKELHELYYAPGSKIVQVGYSDGFSDRTGDLAVRRGMLERRMELVEQTAMATDPELVDYILTSVTDGVSYEFLMTRMNIPCCRDTFYDRYRKFFKLLSQKIQRFI